MARLSSPAGLVARCTAPRRVRRSRALWWLVLRLVRLFGAVLLAAWTLGPSLRVGRLRAALDTPTGPALVSARLPD